MHIWLLTDTHFRDRVMIDYCGRPEDFDKRILDAWQRCVKPDDLLIHLGDIGMHDTEWAHQQIRACPGKKVLTLGNHDKNSWTWYMSNGWDVVCESFTLNRYGRTWLFSHKPQPDLGHWDLNVHGHFHNNPEDRWELDLKSRLTPKHRLLAIENTKYQPVLLHHLM